MRRKGWAAGAVPARGVWAALTLLAFAVTLSIFLRGQDRGSAPSDEESALDKVIEDLPKKDPQFERSKDVLDELSKLLADPNARPGWVARHVNKKRLVDLDPNELRAEVDRARSNNTVFSDLNDEDRRLLWARGVPAALLGLPEAMPPDRVLASGQWKWWHAPAVVASEVLKSEKLPSAKALIDLDKRLRRVASLARNQLGDRFDEHFAFRDFQVARTLLDRALGVDNEDFGGSDKRLVAAPQQSQEWKGLCERLKEEESWGWELLARLLNSPSSTDADELGKLLANVKKVLLEDAQEQKLWTTCQKLIQRVREKKLESPGELALAADVRVRQRQERAKKEQEFLQAWQAGDNDKILRTMQEAKAAGLGLDPNRIVSRVGSLDAPNTLQGLLRNPHISGNPGVHLYVELLQVSEVRETSEKRCYALLLRADRQGIDTQPGRGGSPPKFEVERLDSDKVTDVLSAAMDKLKKTGGDNDFNARVVIALDVVDPDQLIQARDVLLRCVQQPEKEAWFLFLPSAAALLEDSPWNEENVLRFAYRLAARLPENPAPLWRSEGAKQEVASVSSPLGKDRKVLLMALARDPNAPPAQEKELYKVCGELKQKPNLALTLPILVSWGDGEGGVDPSPSPGGRQ